MLTTEPIRILLVEDNAGDARLVEELLAECCSGQATVRHAASTADAMKALKESVKSPKSAIDIVLLDLSMPDGQWLATFGQMRDVAPRVPIVVLTGIDDDALAIRSVREGAQDYLVKGDVSPQRMRRAIQLAIERHRRALDNPPGKPAK